MRRFLIMLLSLLLVISMLAACSCGGNPSGPNGGGDDPDDPDDPNTPVIDVTDPSSPLRDPSGASQGTVIDKDVQFIAQPALLYADTAQEKPTITQAFANAQDIIDKGRPEVPVYGIYAWNSEYYIYQNDISKIGFTNIRTSSTGMTHSKMKAFCDSGISVMMTFGVPTCSDTPSLNFYHGADRSAANMNNLDNYDLAGWIKANVDRMLEVLGTYGPNGTFFDEVDTNYCPIRCVEIFNEPNFQYMIPIKKDSGADDANNITKTKMYVMLQVCIYAAVKNHYPADGEVTVVGFGAGGADGLDQQFIREALALTGNADLTDRLNTALSDTSDPEAVALRELMGLEDGQQVEIDAGGTMDALSTHPYIDDCSPFAFNRVGQGASLAQALQQIRTTLVTYAKVDEASQAKAANMPIWYTECGWQIKGSQAYAEAYPEDVANGLTGGMWEYKNSSTGTSQIIQAAMEVQDYLFAIRNGVDRITFMHLMDTDGCNYGILNMKSDGFAGDGSWRLTCYAIQNMINLLPDPLLHRVVQEGNVKGTDDYIYIYEIESKVGGEIVTVAFSPLKATKINVPWEDEYALVSDMFGNTKILKAINGKVSIDGGPYLMYLRHIDRDTLIANGYIPTLTASVEVTPVFYAWQGDKNEFGTI